MSRRPSLSPTTVNATGIMKGLGRDQWRNARPFGPVGWVFDNTDCTTRVIVTQGPADESNPADEWVHASISHPDTMPTYDELTKLHAAVFPNGWSYQVFAPPSAHINIHAFALHLWGRPDGTPVLPNFGARGTI